LAERPERHAAAVPSGIPDPRRTPGGRARDAVSCQRKHPLPRIRWGPAGHGPGAMAAVDSRPASVRSIPKGSSARSGRSRRGGLHSAGQSGGTAMPGPSPSWRLSDALVARMGIEGRMSAEGGISPPGIGEMPVRETPDPAKDSDQRA